jgi:hypothetical protein
MWCMAAFACDRAAGAAGFVTVCLPYCIAPMVRRIWSSGAHRTFCASHPDSLYLPLGRLLIRL